MARSLAPLAPDLFLAWAWLTGPRAKGTHALTVADHWFTLAGEDPEIPLEFVRRSFVRLAARVRANQRMGWDAWEGLV